MPMFSPRFNDLSVVQLLQNVDDYYHILIREPYLCCNFTLEILIKWSTDRLFMKWPMHFPDFTYVLDRIKELIPPFSRPGCTMNKIRFYNFVVNYRKKRPKKELIFYLYTF